MVKAKNHSNLAIRVSSKSGHTVNFKPGEERQIPAVLALECAGAGLHVTGHDFTAENEGATSSKKAAPKKKAKAKVVAADETITVNADA